MGNELGADALMNAESSGKTRAVVGVTGPICGGKNAVCSILEKKGFFSIDVDKVGHEALEAKNDEIVRAFGTGILDSAGTIDRAGLGTVVFSSRRALETLEGIVHPWMNARVGDYILSNSSRDIVINAAVLFKMGLDGYCDRIIWVDAPVLSRLKRLRERSRTGILDALRRIWSQRRLRTQYSPPDTDIYDIENSGSMENLSDQVFKFLQTMRI